MSQTPRIRAELTAQPAEEDGCKFFDVADPKSGASMRMYDFEWLIAAQMNGARGFDEVAQWARTALGIDPSTEALEEFAAQLASLGFFELAAGAPVAAPRAIEVVTPAPTPAPLAAAPPPPSRGIEIEVPTPAPTISAPDEELPPMAALHEGTFAEDERTVQSMQTKDLIERSKRQDFDEPAPTVKKQLGRIEMQKVPASEANRPPKQSREPSGSHKLSPATTPAPEALTPTPTPVVPPPAAAKTAPAQKQPVAKAAPVAKTQPMTATKPVAPVQTGRGQAAPAAKEKPRIAPIVGLVAVVLAVGAGVAYIKGFVPMSSVDVAVMNVQPKEFVRFYDGKGIVERGATGNLSFPEGGKVVEIAAVGTEVKPGMPLATLDGYAKVQKELRDVTDRQSYYEHQAQALKQKGQDEQAKKIESKIAEKQKLLTDLQARAAKLRIVAVSSGTVAEVLAPVGTEAKPGAAVLKLGGNAAHTELKVPPAEVSKMPVGAELTLQNTAGTTLPGKVLKADPEGTLVVEINDETIKPGDEVRLVKYKLPKIVTLPASAIVGKNGVFVAAGGTAHKKQVIIAEQTSHEVLVSGGLTTGEQVITSNVDNLQDGQRVKTK